MSDSVNAEIANVMKTLDIEYTVIQCDPTLADTQVFCEHYGYSIDESVNAILIASKKKEQKFAVCLVPAKFRLDVNKTVRKKLGASRISFASPEVTRELTGMELGGVTPFGLPQHVPVWIDSRVMDCEQIILGSGNRSSKIALSPAMLLKIPNVEVMTDLAK